MDMSGRPAGVLGCAPGPPSLWPVLWWPAPRVPGLEPLEGFSCGQRAPPPAPPLGCTLSPGEAGPGGLVPRGHLQPPSVSSQASTTRQRPSCWTAGGSSWSSGEWGLRGRGRGRGRGSSTSEVFPEPRKLSDLSQASLKKQEGVLFTFRVE